MFTTKSKPTSAQALAAVATAIAAAEKVCDRRLLATELEASAIALRRTDFNLRASAATTTPRVYSGNLP